MYRFFHLPLLSVLIAGLAACTGVPQRPGPPALSALEEAAQPLVAQGDYLGAAQLYLSAAQTAPENQRPVLRLRAAELLADGQHWDQVEQLAVSLQPASLEPGPADRYHLLSARRALARQQPDSALQQLARVKTPEMLPDLGRQFYRLRATAYARSGNALEAARQLIWLDGLLDDAGDRLENQYRIWEQLSSVSSPALKSLKTAPPPDALSGWMELVLLTREYRSDRDRWTRELQHWRSRYPRHAAENALLPDLLYQMGQFVSQASQIAVLLPFSGATGEAANAVRDGMLAAFYQSPDPEPTLRFYDTAGNAQLIWSIYQRAIDDGADFVVGPLLKDSIQALSLSGLLPVPVLALNQIADTPADTLSTPRTQPELRQRPQPATHSQDLDSNSAAIELPLYQFGLAPEDEARQAAERALADGHQRLVALVPDSAWGGRVYRAFERRVNTLGGELVAAEQYRSDSADFSQPIRRLFNLDDSGNRYQALQRLLGKSLKFEPRRRQDAQAIFLLAFPQQARQLKPQLKFHHAGDLPVYSTSHVYQAGDGPATERDMDGMMFCDIPWVLEREGHWAGLRERTESLWPDRSQRYQRLFALGFDAYQLVPWLDLMHLPGFAYFPGATGVLSLDADKQLHRDLLWARFHRGEVQPLQESASMSTEGQHEPENYRR